MYLRKLKSVTPELNLRARVASPVANSAQVDDICHIYAAWSLELTWQEKYAC